MKKQRRPECRFGFAGWHRCGREGWIEAPVGGGSVGCERDQRVSASNECDVVRSEAPVGGVEAPVGRVSCELTEGVVPAMSMAVSAMSVTEGDSQLS